jgi:hypothetical protein
VLSLSITSTQTEKNNLPVSETAMITTTLGTIFNFGTYVYGVSNWGGGSCSAIKELRRL